VYIGGASAIAATNRITVTHDGVWTNEGYYVDESLNGSGSTIEYYDSYDLATFLTDAQTIETITTNEWVNTWSPSVLSQYEYGIYERKYGAYNETSDTWSSSVLVKNERLEIKNYRYEGCRLSYPSVFAVTNGYVKKVTVYAALEAIRDSTQPYFIPPSSAGTITNHSVSGDYWYEGNHGVLVSNMFVNIPSHTVDVSRVKGTHKQFLLSGNFGFTDTSKFSKLFEVEDPTEEIVFDLQCPEIQHGDPTRFYSGFDWTGTAIGEADFIEGFSKYYSLDYSVKIKMILIVVDWQFKHLGGGFEPVTNNPAWKE
jgi:hypothetical protein